MRISEKTFEEAAADLRKSIDASRERSIQLRWNALLDWLGIKDAGEQDSERIIRRLLAEDIWATPRHESELWEGSEFYSRNGILKLTTEAQLEKTVVGKFERMLEKFGIPVATEGPYAPTMTRADKPRTVPLLPDHGIGFVTDRHGNAEKFRKGFLIAWNELIPPDARQLMLEYWQSWSPYAPLEAVIEVAPRLGFCPDPDEQFASLPRIALVRTSKVLERPGEPSYHGACMLAGYHLHFRQEAIEVFPEKHAAVNVIAPILAGAYIYARSRIRDKMSREDMPEEYRSEGVDPIYHGVLPEWGIKDEDIDEAFDWYEDYGRAVLAPGSEERTPTLAVRP